MEETFKTIPGFENYEAGTLGNIRSKFKRFGCRILVQCLDKYGYYKVCLRNNQKNHSLTVHRLIAITYVPNPYNKPQVNHKDLDKTNNKPSNFEWVTNSENQQHSFDNNPLLTIRLRGENQHHSKLTNDKVLEIRKSNKTCAQLAIDYNMSYEGIWKVINRKTWNHI